MPVRTLIIAILFGIGAWYSLEAYAGYQTLKQLHACGKAIDLSNRIKSARSEAEYRTLMVMEIECMDRNLGFPPSLFFDKNESIASIRFQKSGTNPDR